MEGDQNNARVVRCLRGVMRCWARRWRVIRKEREASDLGQNFIFEAVRCRELARGWEQQPAAG